MLWIDDPDAWAPQNLSCDANTRRDGLDVVATRAIAAGEALTIDYGLLTALDAEPFDCMCRAATCRGRVTRREGNSVTRSELGKRQLRTRGTTYAGKCRGSALWQALEGGDASFRLAVGDDRFGNHLNNPRIAVLRVVAGLHTIDVLTAVGDDLTEQ